VSNLITLVDPNATHTPTRILHKIETNRDPLPHRNRNPPDGYRVMRFDLKDGEPVAAVTSKTAQIPVMENQNTRSCPNSCFRPVGLSFDKKGRLYVSSDTSGEIHVIYGA